MKNKNNNIQIISELHPQHSGSKKLLYQMALMSQLGGADSIKLQLYSVNDVPNGAKKDYLVLNDSDVSDLTNFCDQNKIDLFFSCFNIEKLKFLYNLGFKKIKIASRSNNNNKIINYCLDNFSEVLISTDNLAHARKLKKNKNIKVLYCVSNYPTFLEDLKMPRNFSVFDGLSDHTIGSSAAYTAIVRGAKIVEKHFTISKALQKDLEKAHICSMDFEELRQIKCFSLDYQQIS